MFIIDEHVFFLFVLPAVTHIHTHAHNSIEKFIIRLVIIIFVVIIFVYRRFAMSLSVPMPNLLNCARAMRTDTHQTQVEHLNETNTENVSPFFYQINDKKICENFIYLE